MRVCLMCQKGHHDAHDALGPCTCSVKLCRLQSGHFRRKYYMKAA
jgi:hypothetical protein